MATVTIAVDLAKNVFEIAIAGRVGTIQHRKRMSRPPFESFWVTQTPCRVVMEACASAGGKPTERTARRSWKRTAAPASSLFSSRARTSRPLALHRVRSQWLQTRTARSNAMRGFLGEFGVIAALGAKRFMNELPALLSNRPELPARVSRIDVVECELEAYAAEEPVVQALVRIAGIGVLTASALFATIGSIHTFKSARQLARWLGLTPRESSSGGRRRLGAISKQGDPYLRMLLIHGARAALNGATRTSNAERPVSQLLAWALERADKAHRNKAA